MNGFEGLHDPVDSQVVLAQLERDAARDILQKALQVDEGTVQDIIHTAAILMGKHPLFTHLLRHCMEQGKRIDDARRVRNALLAETVELKRQVLYLEQQVAGQRL